MIRCCIASLHGYGGLLETVASYNSIASHLGSDHTSWRTSYDSTATDTEWCSPIKERILWFYFIITYSRTQNIVKEENGGNDIHSSTTQNQETNYQ